ncbi:hypothetical protein EXIGLDRAFT_778741 [Exidia glandulosa HHB12029]|uniref:Uncharacterized protein n=1 Tax=Exidia glandulosa HHB12029 TaxID=1314781 RepID=A0A165CEA2_EXIGL|nr:hypothetical protein EXIGLDRAFT_778741 [Exidia glandulosa HHB12029]
MKSTRARPAQGQDRQRHAPTVTDGHAFLAPTTSAFDLLRTRLSLGITRSALCLLSSRYELVQTGRRSTDWTSGQPAGTPTVPASAELAILSCLDQQLGTPRCPSSPAFRNIGIDFNATLFYSAQGVFSIAKSADMTEALNEIAQQSVRAAYIQHLIRSSSFLRHCVYLATDAQAAR